MLISLSLFLFFSEKQDQNPDIDKKRDLKQLFKVAAKLFQKRKVFIVVFFVLASRGLLYTVSNLGSPYLFGVLKHDRSMYSLITLIGFPINITCSMMGGYIAKNNALIKYYCLFWVQLVIDTFVVFVLYYNYELIIGYSKGLFDLMFAICYLSLD
jgi:hypothetical protein